MWSLNLPCPCTCNAAAIECNHRLATSCKSRKNEGLATLKAAVHVQLILRCHSVLVGAHKQRMLADDAAKLVFIRSKPPEP